MSLRPERVTVNPKRRTRARVSKNKTTAAEIFSLNEKSDPFDFDLSRPEPEFAGKAAPEGEEEEDDDLPEFMHGKVNREEYLLARQAWVNAKLGMEPGLPTIR